MRFEYILFDLDGTLTESAPGITKSAQYALQKLGIEEPDLHKLEKFVGPPLNYSFATWYGLDEEQTSRAVRYYRERYTKIGLYENSPYEGIPQMLRTLQENGHHLAVASSKPEEMVFAILRYFKLEQYFEMIHGADMTRELDGKVRKSDKEMIVADVLDFFGAKDPDFRAKTAMVGDRMYDMEGALANHVTAVGVTYGYGSEEELQKAGADLIAYSVAELSEKLSE